MGFIGSIETGHRVAERGAGKAQLLEMGGNGPVVVLEDANLDAAVEATLTASFLCAGQSCTAGELFLVHEAVHDDFLERLAARVAADIRLGDPFADKTTMGPLMACSPRSSRKTCAADSASPRRRAQAG